LSKRNKQGEQAGFPNAVGVFFFFMLFLPPLRFWAQLLHDCEEQGPRRNNSKLGGHSHPGSTSSAPKGSRAFPAGAVACATNAAHGLRNVTPSFWDWADPLDLWDMSPEHHFRDPGCREDDRCSGGQNDSSVSSWRAQINGTEIGIEDPLAGRNDLEMPCCTTLVPFHSWSRLPDDAGGGAISREEKEAKSKEKKNIKERPKLSASADEDGASYSCSWLPPDCVALEASCVFAPRPRAAGAHQCQ